MKCRTVLPETKIDRSEIFPAALLKTQLPQYRHLYLSHITLIGCEENKRYKLWERAASPRLIVQDLLSLGKA